MLRRTSLTRLQLILGSMAAVASLLAVQSLLWPRWPSVDPLDPEAIGSQLQTRGFKAGTLPSLPARRSFERSTSEVLGFSLGAGNTLRLLRGSVRERFDLSGALLAAAVPSLTLKNRQLLAGPPPSALGLNNGSKVRQTCLVSGEAGGGGFAMDGEQLLALVDQLPATRLQRLQVLLGLRPTRDYGCVLISVISPPGRAAMAPERWQALVEAVQEAVGPQPSTERRTP